ncbi:unnamed protein product [Oppiella nova]|uniref:Uncharacterized protein n=1 Tax=Oppiella nova TaxID=334625 RepID=A0A7R9LT20_9ACAR|nr:unnamed protein product [Oppiella nova]CAG2166677.1 unnamed protein product [Oppiella nova]
MYLSESKQKRVTNNQIVVTVVGVGAVGGLKWTKPYIKLRARNNEKPIQAIALIIGCKDKYCISVYIRLPHKPWSLPTANCAMKALDGYGYGYGYGYIYGRLWMHASHQLYAHGYTFGPYIQKLFITPYTKAVHRNTTPK